MPQALNVTAMACSSTADRKVSYERKPQLIAPRVRQEKQIQYRAALTAHTAERGCSAREQPLPRVNNTASSQDLRPQAQPPKKRKLGPFNRLYSLSPSDHSAEQAEQGTDSSTLPSAGSSPSIEQSDSQHSPPDTTSPIAYSHACATSSLPRITYSQLADSTRGSSPSGDVLGAERPVGAEMSESGHGRTMSTRSASPAKRSATEMEQSEDTVDSRSARRSSSPVARQEPQMNSDISMTVVTPTTEATGDVPDIVMKSVESSSQRGAEASGSIMSFQIEDSPPLYAAGQASGVAAAGKEEVFTTQDFDEQYEHVNELMAKPLDEGDRGVVISTKWLNRVLARTSQGLASKDYPEDARHGAVGPLDNSDILASGAVKHPILTYSDGQLYLPLRSGVVRHVDFEVVPYKAYGRIIGDYGLVQKFPILRFAHAVDISGLTKIEYELDPPIITIRKVPRVNAETQDIRKGRTPFETERFKTEQSARGQLSPDDAVRLVVSRHDPFQKFLARAKEAAGIPVTSKVKVWYSRISEELSTSGIDRQQEGSDILAVTDESSETAAPNPVSKLVIDSEKFGQMKDAWEAPDIAKDETNNSKYNGSMSTSMAGLSTDRVVVLQELTSTTDKKPAALVLSKPNNISKTSSTNVSRQSSPAAGVAARGRAMKSPGVGNNGLDNLGNTCYMNAALQCFRSIPELSVYFLTERFKGEINKANKLGSKGAISKAYYELVAALWQGHGSYSPRTFKYRMGSINSSFSSYSQEDSQEFLMTLIDALLEDLGRVHEKPVIQNPDSDDARVHDPEYIVEFSNHIRDLYLSRSDSVITDLLLGFYKNSLKCHKCGNIRVNFDPYLTLTLQLPIGDTINRTVTLIPNAGPPIKIEFDLKKSATIKDVKRFVAQKSGAVEADRLWMAEIYSHKLFKTFRDGSTISEANINTTDDIVIFELDRVPTNVLDKTSPSARQADEITMDNPYADIMAVPVFSRCETSSYAGTQFVLHPMYITVTREEAKNFDIVMKKVLIEMDKLTSFPVLQEIDKELKSPTHRQPEDDDEQDHLTIDDTAGISDHSADDGYVNVCTRGSSNGNVAASTLECEAESKRIPAGFMESNYLLPPGITEKLFSIKTATSSSGLHCASFNSIRDGSVRSMRDRVKQPMRRASVNSVLSTSSSQASSTESDEQVNKEADADDEDQPDLILGAEDTESSQRAEHSDTGELAPSSTTIMEPSDISLSHRDRRRRHKTTKRFGKGRNMYKKSGPQDRGRYANHDRTNASNAYNDPVARDVEDNPYYIKLSEAIVLDWSKRSFNQLFGAKLGDQEHGMRTTDDSGQGLSVLVDNELKARKEVRASRSKNGVELDACFEKTIEAEDLTQDNAWDCPRCKERHEAQKQLQIWSLPDILILHIKRFTEGRKIDTLVRYPVEGLDLNRYVEYKDGKNYTYDLFAVDEHSGTLGFGHYTAKAKSFVDGNWYNYNDSHCSKIKDLKSVETPLAYVLFYRRRSDQALGPPYFQDLMELYKNPPLIDANEAQEGEGQLGGPHTSLHGSSSASAAAAEAENNSNRSLRETIDDGGGVGALPTADSSLTTKPTTTTTTTPPPRADDADNECVASWHPERNYGNQGNDEWSFTKFNCEEDEKTMRGYVQGNHDDHDEISSNVAEHDSTFEDAHENMFQDDGGSQSNVCMPHMDGSDEIMYETQGEVADIALSDDDGIQHRGS